MERKSINNQNQYYTFKDSIENQSNSEDDLNLFINRKFSHLDFADSNLKKKFCIKSNCLEKKDHKILYSDESEEITEYENNYNKSKYPLQEHFKIKSNKIQKSFVKFNKGKSILNLQRNFAYNFTKNNQSTADKYKSEKTMETIEETFNSENSITYNENSKSYISII